ncbi:MAG: hypothetical protein JNM07_11770 [Phycisphaerae bacterium]|nr:hypothetical protein [Phycisphaerae bacterium]
MSRDGAWDNLRETTAWAAYLACSWTWCIGMFLPVLLWRDFGAWSLAVFAAPNIVGAGAMAWSLARPGASERFAREHRSACRAFGIITVAFQAFFLAWLLRMLGASGWIVTAGIVGAGVLSTGIGLAARGWRRGAVLTWAISIGLAIAFVSTRGGIRWPEAPASGARDLIWLAPVCILGFALCPYLDLTFHAARQATTAAKGKAAFALGFGVLFAAMIAFTAVYAAAFISPGLGGAGSVAGTVGIGLVAGHMVCQLLFTIGVHGSELRRGRRGWDPSLAGAVVIASALGGATEWPGYAGLTFGEVVYRGFMAFYGLVFPAYVWICARPIGWSTGPRWRSVSVFVAAVTLAGPCYWLGFIERRAWWLAPGVAIVLMARLALARVQEPPPAGADGSRPLV